jgi:hypothetical protein
MLESRSITWGLIVISADIFEEYHVQAAASPGSIKYRQTDPDGVRRIKAQTFSSDKYATEASVWKALEGQLGLLNENTLAGKVEYTFGQLCNSTGLST